MRRRAYLSTIAAAFAGCGQQTTDPTETGTEAPTRTTTATAIETATATETASPTPADPLVRFENALVTAVDRYVPSGSSFADVDASNTDVEKSAVLAPLEDARELRDRLADEELTGERRDRFERLSGTFRFLWWTAHAHGHLTTAWERHRAAWTAVLARDGGPAETISSVESAAEDARADLNRLVAKSTADDLAAFPPLVVADHQATVEGRNADVSGFDRIVDRFDAFNSAMRDTEHAMAQYEGEKYARAAISFTELAETYGSLADAFTRNDWPETFEQTRSEARCVARAMRAGCDRMATVARSVDDNPDQDATSAAATARDEFESCDLVAEEAAVVSAFYE